MNFPANTFLTQSNNMLPFFGTLKVEYEPFHFFISEMNEEELRIMMPYHLGHAYPLKQFDLISFHLAFVKDDIIYSRGKLLRISPVPEVHATLFDMELIPEIRRTVSIFLKITHDGRLEIVPLEPPKDILLQAYKNLILLKQGVRVYLKHLATYFSRLIGTRLEAYPEFAHFFFENIQETLNKKIVQLSNWYDIIKDQPNLETMCKSLILNELINVIESEVNLDLMNITFETDAHLPYIIAIKELEETMYWSYNSLVLTEQLARAHQYSEEFHKKIIEDVMFPSC